MLRFSSALVVAVVLGAAGWAAAQPQVVDRIVAVIEDEIVTLRELEAKASPFMSQLSSIADPAKKAQKRQEILTKVLDIEVGERIVNKEIAKNQDRLGVTGKDVDRAIAEVLKINNMTREQLQAALYGQGMTWSEYRKKLREQIERARLIQFKVQGRVQVKEAAVKRRCLERAGATDMRVCASHILIRIPDGSSKEDEALLKAKIAKLQAELASGADFAAYALQHSQDDSAPDGDIGCFGRGEMVEPFEAAAYGTTVGDVSPVVRTSFGFHIIKVYDRRNPSTGICQSPEELQPFQGELYQEELERQMNIWIDELRRKAFVEVRL